MEEGEGGKERRRGRGFVGVIEIGGAGRGYGRGLIKPS